MNTIENKYLLRFRRIIGCSVILCIPICVILYRIFGTSWNVSNPYNAFSYFYWTNVRPLFIAGLSILLIFYCVYQGENFFDKIINFLSILSCLLLIAFPVSNYIIQQNNFPVDFNLFPNIPAKTTELLHNIGGLSFFALQGLNIIMFAVSTDKKLHKYEYMIYWISAALILAIVVFLIFRFIATPVPKICFVCQIIGFVITGICWLIKGQAFRRQ